MCMRVAQYSIYWNWNNNKNNENSSDDVGDGDGDVYDDDWDANKMKSGSEKKR